MRINRKLRNSILILTIVFILFTLIISRNEAHLDHCHEDNCEICSIIHMAQIIVRNSFIVIINIMTIIVIHNIFIKICWLKKESNSNSLVFQKVQLNE